MTHDEGGYHAGGHEERDGDERAQRQPAQSAHAMTAGAAAAHARAEADEEPGERDPAEAEALADRGGADEGMPGEAGSDEPGDEPGAPEPVAGRLREQAVQDAADASDAAVGNEKPRAGEADQGAAGQGRERSKVLDRHGLQAALRSAVLNIHLPPRRRRVARGGADRSGVRAGAPRRRARRGAGPEAVVDAGDASARRPRHRRLTAEAKARQPHRTVARERRTRRRPLPRARGGNPLWRKVPRSAPDPRPHQRLRELRA